MALSQQKQTSFVESDEASMCFGYATALEILRTASTSKLPLARIQDFEIPDEVPSSQDIDKAIEQIERIYSGFTVRKPVHILVRNSQYRRTSNICVSHLCNVPPSNDALWLIKNSLFISSPAFVFTQMATQLKNPLALLQLGFELCGTYQTRKTASEYAYQVPPLMSTHAIKDFIRRNPSLSGVKKVRQALTYIMDGSASPRETKLALLLGLPMMYGGYGLGMPLMNYEVENNSEATAISNRSYLKCDLCWPDANLDVEYQSCEMHAGEESRIRDSRRTNALSSMGWKVINITNDEFDSVRAMDGIADTIRKHLGKRCRINIKDHDTRNLKLRAQLGLPTNFV